MKPTNTISLTLLCCSLLTACYTPHRAQKQVMKAQLKHPEVVASFCAGIYPPATMRRDSLVYRQGNTVYLPADTVQVNCDTVYNNRIVKLPCPPATLRVDTIRQYTERQVENTARVAALQLSQQELQHRYEKQQWHTRLLLWWALAATALLAIIILFKSFKPFHL